MPAPIKDEFSGLPLSRQRRYQLRNRRDGKCTICGGEVVTKNFCERHALVAYKRVREWYALNGRGGLP